jgi:glycosyltransferase involved in cell wall biosynthesis
LLARTGLRILYTHRTQGLGAEGVHIMGMVEAFREIGHDVCMDSLAGCDPFDRNAAPASAASAPTTPSSWRRTAYRIISEHSPQFAFGAVELLYNVPLLWRLWRRIKRYEPDLVYERYAVGNFAPALLCRLAGIPLVLEVNDSVVIERSRPLSFARLNRWIERRILRSAALVITISQRFRSTLLQSFALPESSILVCPNAVSAQRFRDAPLDRRDVLREQLGLHGRRVVLGSAGQFVAWHGLAKFVAAMADLAKRLDAAFLFIGDGPVRADVMAAARAAGVEDRVRFTGMVPHALIPSHLALLDIAVIPFSNVHGSPMKLMEFMAMGLPVIAPDLPPIREVLEDKRTGRMFRTDDMDDMRRVLTEMLENPEDSLALGRNARDHVLANLTWDAHARQCIDELKRR